LRGFGQLGILGAFGVGAGAGVTILFGHFAAVVAAELLFGGDLTNARAVRAGLQMINFHAQSPWERKALSASSRLNLPHRSLANGNLNASPPLLPSCDAVP
jgi:hypothetical protein